MDEEGQKLLEMVTDRLGLSARTYSRKFKVARTIADLAGCETIQQAHLSDGAVQEPGSENDVKPALTGETLCRSKVEPRQPRRKKIFDSNSEAFIDLIDSGSK